MYISNLIPLFTAKQTKEDAIEMEKYMRDKFPFLGIRAPERKVILRDFYQESNILKEPFQVDFVASLWEQAAREYQYAGVDYIERSLKKLEKEHLLLMEKLIITKSWWDTVDLLAQKAVGKIAKDHPEVIPETIEGWATSDNIWLQRTAILFQLKNKGNTDEELLYHYIQLHNDSNEFFIQKAIGWALREYSKTNPASVKRFIENNELAKLSVREGSKYLD
ncbi:DNA alkylation repair protein [Oceanobacillus chungangensis]|uniref:DNA alkylation repair protein n=1 Tax=Oceanobacillus chungangensis TaxID=1229152 RepID=A0A3D8PR39_9BACI|nr:DNA alkylation repair protein [Oceanobacillus chungangensis]RDW17728.1 DNA alkylation repair protein [Oceanobacillus chungangensis]